MGKLRTGQTRLLNNVHIYYLVSTVGNLLGVFRVVIMNEIVHLYIQNEVNYFLYVLKCHFTNQDYNCI